jgi:hypothetical protein
MKPRIAALLCIFSLLLMLSAQVPEAVDLKAIDQILGAQKSSQVMDVAAVLTNTYGPRLTNSPNLKAAGEYARKKLVEWKLSDVRLETFNFGNGWKNEQLTIKLAADPAVSFQAYSKPWTVGTKGMVTAEVVEGVRSQADLAAMKGKLRGKFVMAAPAPAAESAAPTTAPPIQRFTDAQLAAIEPSVATDQCACRCADAGANLTAFPSGRKRWTSGAASSGIGVLCVGRKCAFCCAGPTDGSRTARHTQYADTQPGSRHAFFISKRGLPG